MEPRPDQPPSKEEQKVWEIVLALTKADHDGVGLVFRNSEVFFFTGSEYNFFMDPLQVFGQQSEISWERIDSSTEAAVRPYTDEELDSWDFNVTNGPQLYRLNGGATAASYKKTVQKEIHLRVSIVEAEDDGSWAIQDFPNISSFKLENSKARVVDFFKERKILSGNYEICRISDVFIDLLLQLDKLPDFLSRKGVSRLTKPGEYGATIDSNRLGYNAETSTVFFQFGITQGPELSDTDLICGLNYAFSFLFNKLDFYVKGSVPPDQFLSSLLGCPSKDLAELLEGEGGLDPFLEDFEYGLSHKDWVSPDLVQVNICRSLTDPSFGRPTEESKQLIQLVETRENFAKTSFSTISVDAYLDRLTRQGAEYGMVQKLY